VNRYRSYNAARRQSSAAPNRSAGDRHAARWINHLMERTAMHNLRWLPTSMLVVLAACPCPISAEESKPEIAITLEKPGSDFVLGQPIPLTVVFQNNLKRDVRIEDFNPEVGLGGSRATTQSRSSLTATGCIHTSATRTESASTLVEVTRISGKSPNRPRSFTSKDVKSRSFVLKAGASEKQSFDLMQTMAGGLEIDSPGRFRVSLEFKMEVETSEGYRVDASDWNWAGEATANPIKITVVSDKK
jgi:hypothetical protein